MSSATATSGLTWEQYLELPEDPKYHKAELVDGKLILVNPPTWLHQHVVGELQFEVRRWIRAGQGRGEVTMNPPVQITAIRGYQPDLAWYRDGRTRPAPGNPYLSGAPDLAVEVLSPSTRTHDSVRKRADYARVGVGELWLIDAEAPGAFVLRPPATPTEPAEFVVAAEVGPDGELTSPLLPGLVIPLRDLLPS